jgi:hypothetical protein
VTHHVGLAIGPNRNDSDVADIYLRPDGNLAMVYDSEAVAQHVRQRLMTYWHEWFLDTEAGVKWLDQIMGHKYNPALAESVVKAEVLDTDGVVDMVSISLSYDLPMRRLSGWDIQAITVYEEEVDI